jgi:hypothetical protein
VISPWRVPGSFYEPDRDGAFVATELTGGRWDPAAQHAGPPAALVGRELERLGGGRGAAPPGPAEGEPRPFPPIGQALGYHTAMEYRFAAGAFQKPGPATVWMRMRYPLVAAEEPTPLERVVIAADSGNGVSAALGRRRYLFINVDLSVHLHRMPEGEWVCLDSVTIPERNGIGISDTRLLDERGQIGRAGQALLVAERKR